jgi:hypothetical protein
MTADKPTKGKAKPKTQAKRQAVLVPQPNGGALWCGPPANPVAGPGRPASAIRAAMRDRLDSEVMAEMHKEWKARTISTEDYADFLGKYGLGIKNEHEVVKAVDPEVRARVRWMFDVVRSSETWERRALLEALMPVWSTTSAVPAHYLSAESK